MANRKNERVQPEKVFSCIVKHPQHDKQMVCLTNPKADDIFALATKEAASRWGVQWGKVLHDCRVDPLAEQWRCTCTRCGKQFLTDLKASECPACVKGFRRDVNQFMRTRGKDTRINAGN